MIQLINTIFGIALGIITILVGIYIFIKKERLLALTPIILGILVIILSIVLYT